MSEDTGWLAVFVVVNTQELVVHRWKLVALVSVHVRVSLSYIYGLFDFSSQPVLLSAQYFGIAEGDGVTSVDAVFTYSCGMVMFLVFFNSCAKGSFGFTNIFVMAVLVAGDLINYATFIFIRCFVFGVYQE
jgi:hypothetical protein